LLIILNKVLILTLTWQKSIVFSLNFSMVTNQFMETEFDRIVFSKVNYIWDIILNEKWG
jgi:hypothetical protein